jgi:hypothetical protein
MKIVARVLYGVWIDALGARLRAAPRVARASKVAVRYRLHAIRGARAEKTRGCYCSVR